MPGGRIRIYYEAVVRDLEAGSRRAERSIDGVGDAADRTNAKLDGTSVAIERTRQSTDHYTKSNREAQRSTLDLSKEIQGINARFTGMRNVVSLIKWPGLIAGAGYAAQGLGEVSAGAIGLTSALAPLSGALVAYPALLGSFAQAMGVGALALSGVKGVLGEMNSAQIASGETAKQSAKAQEAAAESVRSAERQLSQAQVGSKRAQHELTLARQEAVRDLEDLKNAAIDAGFGEKRAAENLANARRELDRARAEPGSHSGAELRSLQLGVEEARQGLKEAKLEKKRADQEAARGSRQGVEKNPKVREAKRQVNEANLQIAESARAVANAEKAQSEAMEEGGSAASKLGSKLAALPAAAQTFAKFIFGLKPKVQELQSTAAEGLFPGVEGGIKSALALFPRVDKAVGKTAKTLGGLAQRAGELVGSKGFGRDFTTIADGNVQIIDRLGNGGLKLADALRQVLVVGQPLLKWMAKSGEQLATWVDNTAKSGRETGKLAGFFEKTRWTMETLWSMAKNVASGFLEIGKAAYPLGKSILVALNGQTKEFSDWTHSLQGRNALREYFAEAKPGIFELGRLVKDVGKDFLSLSKGQGFFELTHALRVELLPVITEVLKSTTAAFGPALVKALVQIGKLLGNLAGSSGPLTLFVESVTSMVKLVNGAFDNVPGLKTFAVTLAGIATVSKAMRFTGMVTGLSSALGIAKKIAVTLGLIDAAEAAAGGGLPIPGLGRRASTTVAGDVGAYGEKQALRDVGLLGSGAAAPSLGARFASALPGFLGTGAGLAATGGLAAAGAFLINPGGGLVNASKTASQREETDAIQKFEGLDFTKSEAQLKRLRSSFKTTMEKLRTDAALGMGAISSALGTGLGIANETWRKGTKQWRDHTAQAMQAAVSEIRQGMKAGTIDAESGHKEINRLLGDIHLVRGSDPFGLSRATVSTFKDVGEVTASGVSNWVKKLEVMPGKAREQTRAATNAMLDAWAQGHPKLEAQVKNLTDYETRKFGAANQSIQRSTANAMLNMAQSAESGASAFSKSLGSIGSQLAAALRALGVTKIPSFQIQQAAKTGTGVGSEMHHREFADGGFLRGTGRRDTEVVMAAPGEAFLTGHQQPEVQAALSFAKTFGVVQNGSLQELFANVTTPHYMASGGIVRPVITGGGPAEREGEQHGVNMVWKAAQKYFERHDGIGRVIANGNRMNALHQPYLWGGGHGATASRNGPWDCSGGTSELAVGAGLDGADFNFAPMVSGGFENWGSPGKGDFTVLANTEHVYSVLKTPKGWKAIGTSEKNPGGGFGWISGYTFRPGFTIRHADFSTTSGSRTGKRDRKGQKQAKGFARGGFTSGDIKHSGVLSPEEWMIAMLLGGFPAREGVLAQGAGTIKSESGFNASSQVSGNEHEGGWALADAFGPTSMKLDPILSSHAAFLEWEKDGGFWQAWGQWEAEQSGLSGGGAGTYGPEYMPLAAAVIKKWLGGGARGARGGAPKLATPTFPAGHTSAGGGTYGSPAGPPGKPGSARQHEVNLPGLAPGILSATAKSLPKNIQAMLKQPGITFAQKLSIGELATTVAGATFQPTLNAAGEIVDSGLDDKIAAEFLKELLLQDKKRVQKKLKEIAKALRSPQTQARKNALQKAQSALLSRLGQDISSLSGLNATIEGEGAEGGGEEHHATLSDLAAGFRNFNLSDVIAEAMGLDPSDMPTALDYANRDLALAELTPDEADDKAARKKILELTEAEFAAARATPDPRDDITAAQNLKAAREAYENIGEIKQNLEAQLNLQKEATEKAERTTRLLEEQSGPDGTVAKAIAAVVSGQIGGKVGLGFATPSVAGSLASY